jgi:hypothetical protein
VHSIRVHTRSRPGAPHVGARRFPPPRALHQRRLQPGRDLYDVRVHTPPPGNAAGDAHTDTRDGVYCDQLGALLAPPRPGS